MIEFQDINTESKLIDLLNKYSIPHDEWVDEEIPFTVDNLFLDLESNRTFLKVVEDKLCRITQNLDFILYDSGQKSQLDLTSTYDKEFEDDMQNNELPKIQLSSLNISPGEILSEISNNYGIVLNDNKLFCIPYQQQRYPMIPTQKGIEEINQYLYAFIDQNIFNFNDIITETEQTKFFWRKKNITNINDKINNEHLNIYDYVKNLEQSDNLNISAYPLIELSTEELHNSRTHTNHSNPQSNQSTNEFKDPLNEYQEDTIPAIESEENQSNFEKLFNLDEITNTESTSTSVTKITTQLKTTVSNKITTKLIQMNMRTKLAQNGEKIVQKEELTMNNQLSFENNNIKRISLNNEIKNETNLDKLKSIDEEEDENKLVKTSDDNMKSSYSLESDVVLDKNKEGSISIGKLTKKDSQVSDIPIVEQEMNRTQSNPMLERKNSPFVLEHFNSNPEELNELNDSLPIIKNKQDSKDNYQNQFNHENNDDEILKQTEENNFSDGIDFIKHDNNAIQNDNNAIQNDNNAIQNDNQIESHLDNNTFLDETQEINKIDENNQNTFNPSNPNQFENELLGEESNENENLLDNNQNIEDVEEKYKPNEILQNSDENSPIKKNSQGSEDLSMYGIKSEMFDEYAQLNNTNNLEKRRNSNSDLESLGTPNSQNSKCKSKSDTISSNIDIEDKKYNFDLNTVKNNDEKLKLSQYNFIDKMKEKISKKVNNIKSVNKIENILNSNNESRNTSNRDNDNEIDLKKAKAEASVMVKVRPNSPFQSRNKNNRKKIEYEDIKRIDYKEKINSKKSTLKQSQTVLQINKQSNFISRFDDNDNNNYLSKKNLTKKSKKIKYENYLKNKNVSINDGVQNEYLQKKFDLEERYYDSSLTQHYRKDRTTMCQGNDQQDSNKLTKYINEGIPIYSGKAKVQSDNPNYSIRKNQSSSPIISDIFKQKYKSEEQRVTLSNIKNNKCLDMQGLNQPQNLRQIHIEVCSPTKKLIKLDRMMCTNDIKQKFKII